MQDYLGTNLEIGDYIFGGIGYRNNTIWLITSKNQAKLINGRLDNGYGSPISIEPNKFVKLSKEQVMVWILENK